MKKHPADRLLKEYLGRKMSSSPPPPDVLDTCDRIVKRMPRERQESGSWDMRDVMGAVQAHADHVAAERLAYIVKWIAGIAAGVIVAVVSASILYVAAKLK